MAVVVLDAGDSDPLHNGIDADASPGKKDGQVRRQDAEGGSADPAAAGGLPPLLEYFQQTVTEPVAPFLGTELAACRCDCWFCADCCKSKGYNLRAELVPILKQFRGLMMLTFTVDPLLFDHPKSAYLYMREHRCLSKTIQTLDRQHHLHTRRYFYVVEFQRITEQAHFHVLIDASYIPFDALLAAWSKHRPRTAGPVVDQRPAFGTALFSKRDFSSPQHAARYATKYLIKIPAHGFPAWVMGMGKNLRVKRFGTSRGFWGRPSEDNSRSKSNRKLQFRSYEDRLKDCGSAINVFTITPDINPDTGELHPRRDYVGRLCVPASALKNIPDSGNPNRRRRLLPCNIPAALKVLEMVTGERPQWLNESFRPAQGGER